MFVRQQWLGHGQNSHTNNFGIRKNLYVDETVVHVLTEIVPACVLMHPTHPISDTMVVKVGNGFFVFLYLQFNFKHVMCIRFCPDEHMCCYT